MGYQSVNKSRCCIKFFEIRWTYKIKWFFVCIQLRVSVLLKMILAQHPHLLSRLCRLADVHRLLRIKFNQTSQQAELLNDLHDQTRSKWNYRFHLLLLVIILVQCQLKKDQSSIDIVISWIGLVLLFMGQAYIRVVLKKGNEIQHYLNALFQFYHLHPEGTSPSQLSFVTKINLTFVHLILVSAYAFPIGFTYGLHWKNPCKSTIAGYWILLECNGGTEKLGSILKVSGFLTKWAVLLPSYWAWSITMHVGVFCTGVIHTLSLICIQQFILRL